MEPPFTATLERRNPHYERLGGAEGVTRLVAAFYRAMDTRADARTIRAMHETDLSRTQDVLVLYLGEWMGGPPRYTAERGAPRLLGRNWTVCGRVPAASSIDRAKVTCKFCLRWQLEGK